MKQTNTKSKSAGATKKPTATAENGNQENQQSSLQTFFLQQLNEIYDGEKRFLSSLTEIKEAVTTEELADAFENHEQQTQKQIKRLEKIFSILQKEPEAAQNASFDFFKNQLNQIIQTTKEGSMTRDAALIIAAQKIEHYEIASYGGLVALALTMGLHSVAKLLDKSLLEEEQTDHQLTFIAEQFINFEAEEEIMQHA